MILAFAAGAAVGGIKLQTLTATRIMMTRMQIEITARAIGGSFVLGPGFLCIASG